ncbi:MAG: response regulator [Bacteroidota bacterium]|nr:response regulator [Bacteroidota bacterium]MDP4213365.1 response regulator [Bacteroidota bacterium]MDP4251526.1 response regulator [Bacteroidota bacterium]
MSERKQNVLIVDDEPDICFLFENILRKRNLQAGCAYNLAEASAQIENKQPYLIFLDNSLPDGRGIDFIPYLKTHCPGAKIVVVTANDSPSDQYAAFLLGADAFLGKPLSLERINKTLDKMIFCSKESPIL